MLFECGYDIDNGVVLICCLSVAMILIIIRYEVIHGLVESFSFALVAVLLLV